MSKRDDRVSLVDMLVHATEAVELLGEAGREDLESDRILQLALTRLMEIVGEAANRVSDATQKRHPQIPWRRIVGTRNRLAHGYDVVDLDILWDIVRNDLPPLIGQLGAIVGEGA